MENIHFHRRYTNGQEVYGKCLTSLISVKCKLYPSEIAYQDYYYYNENKDNGGQE